MSAAGASVLDACCGTGDLTLELARRVGHERRGHRRRLLAAHARARPRQARPRRLRARPAAGGRRARAAAAGRPRRRRDRRLRRAQPRRPRRAASASCERVVRPGGRIVCLEITTPESGAARRASTASGSTGSCRPSAGSSTAAATPRTRYLPASVRRFPPPVELGHVMQLAGLASVRYTLLAGGIVALHVGRGAGVIVHEVGAARRRRACQPSWRASRRRLGDASRWAGGTTARTRRRDARGGRQAPAPAARLPRRAGRRPQPRRTWCAPRPPSSSCTWRRSCTTTCSTAPPLRRGQADGLVDGRRRDRRRDRRLPLRPRLRRAGRDRRHAVHRPARALLARPLRGRGDAAASRPGGPRPRPRSTWSAARSRPAGCSPRPARSAGGSAAWTTPTSTSSPPTAAASAWPSRSPTTCSTARAAPSRPASRSAPTCWRASRPCRCCSPRATTTSSARPCPTPPAPGDVLPVLARVATSGALAEARETRHGLRPPGRVRARPGQRRPRHPSAARRRPLGRRPRHLTPFLPETLPAPWPSPSPPTSSSRSARR